MARHLIKFRWKIISISLFFFLLGNLVSLFFIPINQKCYVKTDEVAQKVINLAPQSPNLVILILSAPNNILKRNSIRNSWLNLIKNIRKDQEHVLIKYYFVIGHLNLPKIDIKGIQNENNIYNDVLNLPIQDSYGNLTLKLITSFEWLFKDSNIDFKYVLKCDDDSFVRIDHLIHELIHLEVIYLKSSIDDVRKINEHTAPYISVNIQSNNVSSHGNRELYWGYMNGAATVFKKGKWKEPSWISCDHYLPYALGGGYLISKEMVGFISRSKYYLRYYHSEDVSVGAWLAPVNNIVRIHDRRFDTEYVSRGCQNYYLIRHNVSPDEMMEMYKNLKEKRQLCTKEQRNVKEYLYDWSVAPTKCCNRVL
ncbi:beta-1,3-galactosyltransferase 6 isoform X1 [Onthophagus taurus]|uniref:beta-1,3-galactosyltransferase 6 isoform X1 n=1 Tax=Onthophagus taurus TaxID=166361 RepID=UPI0039BDB4CC